MHAMLELLSTSINMEQMGNLCARDKLQDTKRMKMMSLHGTHPCCILTDVHF